MDAEDDRDQREREQADALGRPWRAACAPRRSPSVLATATSHATSAQQADGEPDQAQVGERLVDVAVRVPALRRLVAEAKLRLREGSGAGAGDLVVLPDVERAGQ